jgi:hypothetical protein
VDDGEAYRLSRKGLLFAAEVFRQFYTQDHVARLKNAVYGNRFLKAVFLKGKYSGSVQAISNLVKTISRRPRRKTDQGRSASAVRNREGGHRRCEP